MRINFIRLKNFKRFTDLHIHSIPETAKMIVVVGPNGCGKSSLFDALLHWHQQNVVNYNVRIDETYYRKYPSETFQWQQNVDVGLHGGVSPHPGCLYVRTAHRNDSDFSVSNLSRPASPVEDDQLRQQRRLIDDDKSVAQNYQRLVYQTTAAVYDLCNDGKNVGTLREELIGQVRSSMEKVFGDLLLNSISDPLGAGSFFFKKGTVESYHYKNLSGGEKAAFDLLFDLHIKKRYFDDAIYCIDEIDAHLHTKIQGLLVREMANIVPGNSQLWVTTHSLGVLRAAQEMEADSPGSVCLISFDGVDLDVPSDLAPSALDRVSWEKLLSITLDDLSDRVAPEVIVVCEGSSVGNRRKDFDADIYERILRTHEPGIVFVSGGNSSQVLETGNSVRGILQRILPQSKVISLADRDDKSDDQVAQYDGITLTERNIESYLLADEIIEALLNREGKPELRDQALQIKTKAIQDSVGRGNPTNDLKSAAGDIVVGLKQLLDLRHHGDSKDAFMKDTLSPLIVPGMETYQKLKSDIVDKIRCP